MAIPLVLLVETDAARSRLLAEAIERQRFRVVAVSKPDAARPAGIVSPDVTAVSLLGTEPFLFELLRGWRDDPAGETVPVLAIVAHGAASAEAALAAGADDVLPWPAPEPVLRARLRGLSRLSIAERERRGFTATLQGLVRAHEARGHRIEHSLRVSHLAGALASSAGLSEAEASRVRDAGLIYDIGLVALGDRILLKEGRLDPEELAEMRSHPVVGYELTKGIPSLEPLRPFILRHHERIDGSGYPDGLKGREIPAPVQLVALADAYDALTSRRPHRSVQSHAAALGTIGEEVQRGIWDRDIVSLLDAACRAVGVA